MNVAEFKKLHPEHNDTPDAKLADDLYDKHYKGRVPKADFLAHFLPDGTKPDEEGEDEKTLGLEHRLTVAQATNSRLKADASARRSELEAMRKELAAAKKRAEELQAQIDERDAQVEKLKTKVEVLKVAQPAAPAPRAPWKGTVTIYNEGRSQKLRFDPDEQ